MRVLIVDDEAIARRRLASLLSDVEEVEIVGEADDGADALEKIEALGPDVVLLDIAMPALDGLQVARMHPQTCIIFTTAYEEHAVEAFSLAATDYLLKPVEPVRLREAIGRASERLAQRRAEVSPLLAQHGRTTRLVDPRTIRRIFTEDKLSCFRLGGRDYHLRESLGELETMLEPHGFVRCHRAELVNVRALSGLRADGGAAIAVLADGTEVPVSRRRLPVLRRVLSELTPG